MKYEHKTVGLNWFDANNRQEGHYVSHPKLGGEDRWRVVGVIGETASNLFHKTFFVLERVVTESESKI